MLNSNNPSSTCYTSTSQKSCSLKSNKCRTSSPTLSRLPRLKLTARVALMMTPKLPKACHKTKMPQLLKWCRCHKGKCRCSSLVWCNSLEWWCSLGWWCNQEWCSRAWCSLEWCNRECSNREWCSQEWWNNQCSNTLPSNQLPQRQWSNSRFRACSKPA